MGTALTRPPYPREGVSSPPSLSLTVCCRLSFFSSLPPQPRTASLQTSPPVHLVRLRFPSVSCPLINHHPGLNPFALINFSPPVSPPGCPPPRPRGPSAPGPALRITAGGSREGRTRIDCAADSKSQHNPASFGTPCQACSHKKEGSGYAGHSYAPVPAHGGQSPPVRPASRTASNGH